MPQNLRFLILIIVTLINVLVTEIIIVHPPQEPALTLSQQEMSQQKFFSINGTKISSISREQRLTLRVKRSPIYAYPGIMVEFLISPAIQRTQKQLEDMIWFDTSDPKYLPPKAYISQAEEPNQVRVVLDYQNNIPYKPFVMVFRVEDKLRPQLGQSRIALVFDSVIGGISSALHMDDKRDDYIR